MITPRPPVDEKEDRPSSRHGRTSSRPPSSPPPGKRSSSSRPSVGGVLRALSPANFLPKLALGGPKKPDDPLPNTPRRPSPRRFMRASSNERGGACVTPRIKGAESPS